MKNRILIIEDDDSVSSVIKAYLEKDGYEVVATTEGGRGIEIFKASNFNLVILDLMLPDISGEEVCKIIRKNSDVNIFMLTAKDTLTDKIEGFNVGADEYLVKPFSPRELNARVNALFRRLNSNYGNSILVFDNGQFILNKEERTLKIEEKEINLTPNEFDILQLLAANHGKIFSREQLIEKVFGYDFEGFDRTVDAHIKNLRKKIEKDSKRPRYIITVVKVGYKFGGDL